MNENDINQLKLLVSVRISDLNTTLNTVINELEREIIKLNKEVETLKTKNKN
jgi:hypothetical protein